MIQGVWGRKVGMTQVFSTGNKVVPVTAVDISGWYVSQIKTMANDGYDAIQVAYARNKYQDKPFELDWLKKKSKYFQWVREIAFEHMPGDMQIGQPLQAATVVAEKSLVDVIGTTKGCGFSGAMRKHGFSGGPASHGSTFKRRLGGVGHMRATGQVIKGKGMAGRMGSAQRTAKDLEVVQVRQDDNLILIKGSMAGKPGSLVFVRKCG